MVRSVITLPSVDRIRELFNFDAHKGVFTWKSPPPGIPVGEVAGKNFTNPDKPTLLSIDGILYPAHRIAWLLIYGSPPTFIGHKDGDKTNNQLGNLFSKQSYGGESVPGVTLVRGKYWRASITYKGYTYRHNGFTSQEEAVEHLERLYATARTHTLPSLPAICAAGVGLFGNGYGALFYNPTTKTTIQLAQLAPHGLTFDHAVELFRSAAEAVYGREEAQSSKLPGKRHRVRKAKAVEGASA